MIDRCSNLRVVIIFKKCSNFYFCKMKIIIKKNIEEKPKNKSKKIKSKIMNSFLVCRFITSCLYKPRKIVDYYQNIIPAHYPTKRLNRSNPVHFNYTLKCKTEYRLQIDTNPSQFIKLAGFISPTISLYIINLCSPILLAPYFIKYKIIGKISIFIICSFENRSYFICKKVLSYLSTSFNIEKMLIYNLVLGTILFDCFFFYKTQILQS